MQDTISFIIIGHAMVRPGKKVSNQRWLENDYLKLALY